MNRYESLFNEDINPLELGYMYSDMMREVKANAREYIGFGYKITYGTQSKRFHLIDKGDRDYNTPFAMTIDDFLKTKNEKEAVDIITSPHLIR